MKNRIYLLTVIGLVALLSFACSEERELFDYESVKLGPVGAGDYVYVGNGTVSRLNAIKAPGADVALIEIPDWTVGLYEHPNKKNVLALSHHPPLLSVIEGEKIKEQIALQSRYDNMQVRSDGKVAALYFESSGGKRDMYNFDERFLDEGGVSAAVNLNELTFVNLESKTTRVITLSASSMNGPSRLLFANPSEGGGDSDNLVAVLMDAAVAVCDVLKAGEGEGDVPCRIIPLRDVTSGVNYVAVDAEFSTDNKYIFVRTSTLDDVIAIRLDYDGASIEASFNIMTSPFSGLSEIRILEGDEYKDNVLAVYRSSRGVALLNAESISSDEFMIENLPIYPGDGSIVMNDGISQYLVAPNYIGSKIIAIDIERRDYKVIETLEKITTFIPSPDKSSAAMLTSYDDYRYEMASDDDDYYYDEDDYYNASSNVIEVAKLKTREEGGPIKCSVATISLTSNYSNYIVGDNADVMYMLLPNIERLVAVDLKMFTTAEVRLDPYAKKLGLTGSEKAIFVEYDSDYKIWGKMALIPTGAGFSRQDSRGVEGYMMSDMFDLPEEEYGNEE